MLTCAEDLAKDVEEMFIEAEDPIERGPNYFKASTWNGGHTEEYSVTDLGGAFSALSEMDSTALEIESDRHSNKYTTVDVEPENLYAVLESASAIDEG